LGKEEEVQDLQVNQVTLLQNIENIIDIKDNNVIRTMPIGVIQVTRGNRAKFMQFNNNRIAPKEHSNSVRQLGQKDLG